MDDNPYKSPLGVESDKQTMLPAALYGITLVVSTAITTFTFPIIYIHPWWIFPYGFAGGICFAIGIVKIVMALTDSNGNKT